MAANPVPFPSPSPPQAASPSHSSSSPVSQSSLRPKLQLELQLQSRHHDVAMTGNDSPQGRIDEENISDAGNGSRGGDSPGLSPGLSLRPSYRPSIASRTSTSTSTAQAWNLYTSHFLSTWNMRSYEFAAIIFTAAAFPDTLVAGSLRGIVTMVSVIGFSSYLGRRIDGASNRLTTLLSTITANRVAVLLACGFWWFILGAGSETVPAPGIVKMGFFAAVLALGVLEKLSAVANVISMERDWVVAVAAEDGRAYDLTWLNAVMRRIDLVCKLVAPIVISIIISDSGSVRVGVGAVGAMSAVSWGLEWWSARSVWKSHAGLRRPKISHGVESRDAETREQLPTMEGARSHINSLMEKIAHVLHQYIQDFKIYFSSEVWIPSLALSLLHISVLAYSSTFITYLLNIGISLNLITIARAVGSVVEISSTVVTPFGVDYLGKAHHHKRHRQGLDDHEENELLEEVARHHGNTETGLQRLGLWGITWQLLNLIPVVLALWTLSPSPSPSPPSITDPPSQNPTLQTNNLSSSLILLTFTFLSLSRLGLWTFDLTTQQLSQTLTPPRSRSTISGVENSLVAFFELGNYLAAMVCSRPEQFRYLAAGSWAAVAVSAGLYAAWVRGRRGHLVHLGECGRVCKGRGI